MFKRILLALTFASALGAVSFVTPDTAEARWGRRGYYRAYYGPPPYYYWGRPYRAYYRRPYYYRSYYYAPRYYGGWRYYDYPRYYYPRRGVYFGFGF